MGDPQLALFLARLLEGGQSSLQQHLLSHELLLGDFTLLTLHGASPGFSRLWILLLSVVVQSACSLSQEWTTAP